MAMLPSATTVTDGLQYFMDMNNQKSYTGPALRNHIAGISPTSGSGTGYVLTGGTEIVNIPTLGETTSTFCNLQNTGASWCCVNFMNYGNAGNIFSGSTVYTYLILYRSDSGYTNGNWMYRYEYGPSGYLTEAGVHDTAKRTYLGNGWYYAWNTFTTQSATTNLTCYSFSYNYSSFNDKISVAKICILQGDYSGLHPKFWPDTNTTKTVAQSVVDLTNNRTTSGFNLHIPSGSTEYNVLQSTNNALTTDSSSILNTDTHSIFFTVRFNTTSTYGGNGYSGSWDKIFSFNAGGSDRSPGIWRYPSQRYIHWRYDPSNSGCDFGKNSSNQDFDIDKWYYIGVTKNGASTIQYVNGEQVGTGSVSNPKTSGSASIILFEYYPNALATLGLIQVYNRVLSPSEVMQNFSATRGRYGI